MKITLGLNLDAASKYAKKNANFLFVSSKINNEGIVSENKHGSFILFINDTPKYGNDCSLAIKGEKEGDKYKYTYVGNGKTTDLQTKLEFENKKTQARLTGETLKNPFQNSTIVISLNMTKIGDYVRKADAENKKVLDQYGCLALNIWVNNECDKFGNDVSVSIAKLTPEEQTIYIGNGKTQAAFNEWKTKKSSETASTTNETEPEDAFGEQTETETDDLPF